MKFALLASMHSVVAMPYLEALRRCNMLPTAIIVDSDGGSSAKPFVRARLDPSFEPKMICDSDIFDAPIFFTNNHNSRTCASFVRDTGIEFLVNAGTPRIIKKDLLDSCNGIVSCHPAQLPELRGCTTVEWAIYLNKPVGATVHFMSEEIDTGPIVLFRSMKIRSHESYEAVRTKMIFHQAALIAEGMRTIQNQKLFPSSLPRQSGGQYFKPIDSMKILELKRKMLMGEYSCDGDEVS